jgi:hypothetical protein
MADEIYSASDLARWGLLEAARREAARDQLMSAVAPPPAGVLEVLRQQWLQQQGIRDLEQLGQWLERQRLAPADFEALVARGWRWQQWCQQHGGAQVASHFLARKAGLDRVSFWRLSSSDADLIAELYQQLREGESSFEQLLQQGGDAWQVSFNGPMPLEQLPPDLAGLLRVSRVGELWAPRQAAEGCWQLLRLEQLQPAVLDEELRAALCQELGERALALLLNQMEL